MKCDAILEIYFYSMMFLLLSDQFDIWVPENWPKYP